MSRRKQTPGRAGGPPAGGQGAGGQVFDPRAPTPAATPPDQPARGAALPAPGSPLHDAEIERLKRQPPPLPAGSGPVTRRDQPQPDPGGEPRPPLPPGRRRP